MLFVCVNVDVVLKTGPQERLDILQLSSINKVIIIIIKQKRIPDAVVTLGTFCYRDQSFINWRGSVIFFHGRRGT